MHNVCFRISGERICSRTKERPICYSTVFLSVESLFVMFVSPRIMPNFELTTGTVSTSAMRASYRILYSMSWLPVSDTYIVYRTNGAEGFKKCRKGTNVAAQTTAMSIGAVRITSR